MPHPIPILLLLVTARSAAAQQSEDDDSPYGLSINSTTAILTVVIISFFFLLCFFSIYFLGRSRIRYAVAPGLPGGAATASFRGGWDRRGLDPALIEAFPILTYYEVTSLKIGGEALECAVCLSEFAGDETLRMLPTCCHVFHPECVDMWLRSHVTCPVCRSDLSVAPSLGSKISRPEEETAAVGEVAIHLERMGRSHSTGHVMRGGGRGGDRFTLRLPEHVRREIVMAGSLRRSASVAVFRGGGERSGRRGYRGFWVGRSDRWATGILARVGTWRRGEAEGTVRKEGAEGSARGGTMFNCLGGGAGSDSGEWGSSVGGVDAMSVSTDQVMDRV